LFTGAYWTGQRSRELGLVDAVGDLRTVLRERFGEKVRTPLIAERGFALFGRRAPGVEEWHELTPPHPGRRLLQ
jgi:serine protease SohB